MASPSVRAAALTAILCAVATLIFAPAWAVSSNVVISQVYTGGGAPGAAYQRDYVVLFNRGTGPVSLSSWSLQLAAGPTWAVIPLCGTIPHGRFYLVALGSSGTIGATLPTAECMSTINLPTASGSIALVSGLTSLPTPCPPPTHLQLMDLLGYGSSAPCFETSPASGLNPTIALFRSPANPCVDTNSNSADFVAITPTPLNGQNTNGCNNAVPAIAPIPDQTISEGTTLSFTASATDPDLDPITFGKTGPSWFTIGSTTGACTIAPPYDAAGVGGATITASVTATDGIGSSSEPFAITVVNVTTVANTPYAARTWHGVTLPTCELAFYEPPDIALGGPLPLTFGRYYASLLEREGVVQGSLGRNWSGTYDWSFQVVGDDARVVSPSGRGFNFHRSGPGAWNLVGPLDLPYRLMQTPTEFRFQEPGTSLIQTFAFLSEQEGYRMDRIEDRNGNQLALLYTSGSLAQVSDGLGRLLVFTNDTQGRVQSVSDGTRTVTYSYTGDDLTSVLDVAGYVTTYSYDPVNPVPALLTSRQDPVGGTSLDYQYDSLGKIAQVGDGTSQWLYTVLDPTHSQVLGPTSDVWSFEHDGAQFLRKLTDPANGTSEWTYDTQRRLTSYKRPSGIQPFAMTYDPASGLLANCTLPDATQYQCTYMSRTIAGFPFYFPSMVQAPDLSQVHYDYDPLGNLNLITDQAQASWTIASNGYGLPTQIVNPAAGTWNLTYDSKGRLASLDDGASVTSYAYDALDRLTTVTRPGPATELFTWNARNLPLSRTNEVGKTWTYAYRNNGQLESVTDPLLASTAFGYDTKNRLTQVTDAQNGVTYFAYNPSWRLQSVTDPTSKAVGFQYDLLGRLTTVTDPGGQPTTLGYDGDSRLTSVTDPLTHARSYAYNNRDFLTSVTDALQHQTTYARDVMGRVTAINRPMSLNSTYGYDARGLLTSASTGPTSVAFTYTPLRRLATFTDGESHVWSRGYDPLGRLTSTTDPLLRSAGYSYDARNRLTGSFHPMGTVSFTYDAASRLSLRLYSDGTVHNYTYDDAGRLLTTEGVTRGYDALGRITSENGLQYTYDSAGRLLTETLAPGRVITHAYDTRGLLSQTTDWLQGATTFAYDAAGRLTSLMRPNGTSALYAYDAADRLLSLREVAAADTIGSVTLSRDALGRVTNAARKSPVSWAPPQTTRTFAYDAASQILGFPYDGLGRRTADDQRAYFWDGASRMDSLAEGGSGFGYAYDGLNRLVASVRSNSTKVEMIEGRQSVISGLTGADNEHADNETDWDFVRARAGQVGYEVDVEGGKSPAMPSVVRTKPLSGGGATDRTHLVRTPEGKLLHAIDLRAPTPEPRYFHFDEAGNTAFLTNGNGSIVSSYAYSVAGDVSSLGEVQPYPAFTLGGERGVIQESSNGLYRVGEALYDARTIAGLFSGGRITEAVGQLLLTDNLVTDLRLLGHSYDWPVYTPVDRNDEPGLADLTLGGDMFHSSHGGMLRASVVENTVRARYVPVGLVASDDSEVASNVVSFAVPVFTRSQSGTIRYQIEHTLWPRPEGLAGTPELFPRPALSGMASVPEVALLLKGSHGVRIQNSDISGYDWGVVVYRFRCSKKFAD